MIDGHGGNIYQLAQTLGCRPDDIVDMSSNVNPLGPMPELMTHLQEKLAQVAALPQVDARAIRTAFARQYDLDPDLILAGNGSTQWIYTLPLAFTARRALIMGPTYADYADACAMHGTRVVHLTAVAEEGFTFDLAAARRMAETVDLVFICNPNNPTGRLISPRTLAELCLSRPETIFVIDESYLPFVPDSQDFSLLGYGLDNAVILTSMSKIFRLPGLRIGFIKAAPKPARRLSVYCLPWTVNSLAAEAVLWLMGHREKVDRFISQSNQLIQKERDLFLQRIAEVKGLICFESATTFLLLRLPDHLSSRQVWQAMAEERLLIRDCSNFNGLSNRYIRISLKDPAANLKAAQLLSRICRAKN